MASELDRLLAAILATDPLAIVLERFPHGALLRLGEPAAAEAVAMLLETGEGSPDEALAALRARIETTLANYEGHKGLQLHIAVVNSRGLDVGPFLVGIVPPRTTVFRPSDRHAHVLTPGAPLKTVRGLASSVLVRAVQHLGSGATVNLEAVSAQRSEETEEARRFFARIGTRRPLVTWTIAGLSVALFGLQLLWGGGEAYAAAPRMGAFIGELIKAGQVWRLLAPMMLHGNVIHLGFNMMALLSFSPFLERFLGWRRYLILYVASGMGGSLAGLLRTNDVTSVGASGAIWGLMVAGAALVTWPRGRLPALVTASQRTRAWTPVAINAVYSFQPGIDWLAHLGGGVVGGLLMMSGVLTAGVSGAGDERSPPAHETLLVRALAVLSAIATGLSVIVALVTGRPWELRSAPTLTRAKLAGSEFTVELPPLTTPPQRFPDRGVWAFGGIRLDPVAFEFHLGAENAGDANALESADALEDAEEQLAPALEKDFSLATPTELRHHGRVNYLFHRQTAQGGRVALETYIFVRQKRLVRVMVLSTSGTSAPWRAAADAVPFSLTL